MLPWSGRWTHVSGDIKAAGGRCPRIKGGKGLSEISAWGGSVDRGGTRPWPSPQSAPAASAGDEEPAKHTEKEARRPRRGKRRGREAP